MRSAAGVRQRAVLLTGFAWLAVAACYDPTLRDCAVSCAGPGECASGQICGADGLCASPELAGQCAAFLDGRTADGPGTDAVTDGGSDCDDRCVGGTCVAGVCEIACGDDACDATVACPAGVPCRVLCHGTNACNGGVRCAGTDPCEVVCSGAGSCSNEVRCGDGRCSVQCSGNASCGNTVKCPDACACDVTCTGPSSCGGNADCPRAACDTGPGCTSQPAQCDQC